MHNVSAEDFDNGETYVSIMRKKRKGSKGGTSMKTFIKSRSFASRL